MTFRNLIGETAAPAGAAALGVYDAAGNRVGVIPAGALGKVPSAAPSYRFGLLSDAHRRTDTAGGYAAQKAHLDRALTFFASAGLPLIAATGDVADFCNETILRQTGSAVEARGYTVGSTFLWGFGNHESQSSATPAERKTLFESVFGAGTARFYTVAAGEDLFAVMHFRKFGDNAGTPCFDEEDLDALEACLASHPGRRIFLIQHALPCRGSGLDEEMAGHAGRYVDTTHWGAGDASTERFLSLIRGEQRLIWLHGHSHYCFELTDVDTKYGHCALTDRALGCRSVHVPSLGALKVDTSQTVDPNGAQAYLVSVYPEGVLFEALDLSDGGDEGAPFLPAFCFWLPVPSLGRQNEWALTEADGELTIHSAPLACVTTEGNEMRLEDHE